jgi:L,D-transpeptidase catalytic domain
MRMLIAAAFLILVGSAQAKVTIVVDKDAQQLTVSVDGEPRYQWPVSTGNPSHETPNGQFQPFRMVLDHRSKEFDDAPMPNSIFFTDRGHAIHGTFSERSLGVPVSHGCVRLSRQNAATLYALVKEQGVRNVTVSVAGSSQTALSHRPAGQRRIVARKAPMDDESDADRPVSYRQTSETLPGRGQRHDIAPAVFAPEAFSSGPAY